MKVYDKDKVYAQEWMHLGEGNKEKVRNKKKTI